jgi:hypothetical protein
MGLIVLVEILRAGWVLEFCWGRFLTFELILPVDVCDMFWARWKVGAQFLMLGLILPVEVVSWSRLLNVVLYVGTARTSRAYEHVGARFACRPGPDVCR